MARLIPMSRSMKLRSAKLGHRPGHAFPCPAWSNRKNPSTGRKDRDKK